MGSLRSSLSNVLHFAVAVLFSRVIFADESSECRDLGFTGLQLCSDCNALATYVSDAELVAECRRCCTAEMKATDLKYSSAVLEVFLDRISAFPHVEDFIIKKAAKFPRLEVVDRYGAAPRLTLMSGAEKKVVTIDGWKSENIEEFLAERLLEAEVISIAR